MMNLEHPLMPLMLIFVLIFIGIPIVGLLTFVFSALTGTL